MKNIFVVLMISIPSLAMAGWTSGNKLNSDLSHEPNDFCSAGFASGYISAVADQASESTSSNIKFLAETKSFTPTERSELLLEIGRHGVCFPKGVTRGQLVTIVKKWLSSNPDRWNENASGLVEEALQESFPCESLDDFFK